MLTIKCAKCKSKIKWIYDVKVQDGNLVCGNCGNIIGEVKDDYVKMNKDAFTYTGTKLKKIIKINPKKKMNILKLKH